MANRTHTELIRELKDAVVAIQNDIRYLDRSVAGEAGRADKLEEKLLEHRDKLADLRQSVAVLGQRLDELAKRVETWDSRRWMLVMAVVGLASSIAGGSIVGTVLKK